MSRGPQVMAEAKPLVEESKHDTSLGQQACVPTSDKSAQRAEPQVVLKLWARLRQAVPPMTMRADAMPPGDCQQAGATEHLGRLGVEGHPPDEQLPRRIDRNPGKADPGRAERRLLPEHNCRPLRGRPYENKC